MSNLSQTATRSSSALAIRDIAVMVVFGAALLFTAGFAQSQTLHDAAHDVRHATGFPCH